MSGRAYITVLDRNGKPLMPCTAKRARLLLTRGRARVVRMIPFVIQLKDRLESDCDFQPMTVKLDPGSKKTGICVARMETPRIITVTRFIELEHRGDTIRKKLMARAMFRRNRRNRKTRYRPARFLNRTKPSEWLPPSLRSRVNSTISWVRRLCRWYPISELAVERVKFDTQKMQNEAISGKGYQQGTLLGYEIREYLLEKWNRTCAYCDTSTSSRLEVEHVIPRSKGGSDRISNLVLACHDCNQKKGSSDLSDFLRSQPEKMKKILSKLKLGLKDASAVNSTRNALFTQLLKVKLPVIVGTGGQTKYNRIRFAIPKTHVSDAACVGDVDVVKNWLVRILRVKCNGRGKYQRTLINKYGNPRAYLARKKEAFGFQTGDIVEVLNKKNNEHSLVSVVIRQDGRFYSHSCKLALNFSWSNCRKIQSFDGFIYS